MYTSNSKTGFRDIEYRNHITWKFFEMVKESDIEMLLKYPSFGKTRWSKAKFPSKWIGQPDEMIDVGFATFMRFKEDGDVEFAKYIAKYAGKREW
jgi:hypothetical protein